MKQRRSPTTDIGRTGKGQQGADNQNWCIFFGERCVTSLTSPFSSLFLPCSPLVITTGGYLLPPFQTGYTSLSKKYAPNLMSDRLQHAAEQHMGDQSSTWETCPGGREAPWTDASRDMASTMLAVTTPVTKMVIKEAHRQSGQTRMHAQPRHGHKSRLARC